MSTSPTTLLSPAVQLETRLDDISLSCRRDRDLMVELNDRPFPVLDKCLPDLLTQWAVHTPDKEVISFTGGSFTYAYVDEISTRLAIHLITLGVKQEDIVPVLFEKSPWMPIAICAIMKAGAAFVPLDLSHPLERHRDLVKETAARVLLCSPGPAADVASSIDVDNAIAIGPDYELPPLPAGPFQSRAQPSNKAYILFTSGSTGKPKGVVIEHRAITSNVCASAALMRVRGDSRVLQFASYVFDCSILEIFAAITAGATICVPNESERLGDTAAFIERQRVSYAILTPSFAATLHPSQVPSLKTMLLAGEAATSNLVALWKPHVALGNAYGPAECSIIATVHFYEHGDEDPKTLGRSTNSRLWIVDPDNPDRLAAVNSVGELVIQGPSLGRGYLNNEEKTNAAFFTAGGWMPWAEDNLPRRFYRTGDLARLDSDGKFHYCGRKDSQIKLRGQRIELGEVEYHINHVAPYVKTAGVETVVGDRGNVEALAAFVVLDEDKMAKNLAGDLTLLLKKRLPDPMIPTYYIPLLALPRTTSDKLDRRALQAKLRSMTHDELASFSILRTEEMAACKTQTELKLRSMWAEILGRDEATIGATDNFYNAGGDSIGIVSLLMLVKSQFKIKLEMDFLNDSRTTLRMIAQFIDSRGQLPEEDSIATAKKKKKKTTLWEDVKEIIDSLLLESWSPESVPELTALPENTTVFLTGASGYLGTEILRDLLGHSCVGTVVAHVRAASEAHGMERLQEAATIAGWWDPSYTSRIEVWTGDLSKPHLGLTETQMLRLQGRSETGNVNAIIHNGAIVNWNADYESLFAGNVTSVVDLLSASLTSPLHPRFVFVSGGAKLEEETPDDLRRLSLHLGKTSGYVKTKFVAMSVVVVVASRLLAGRNPISLVKPGKIIGRGDTGVANTDDFLWRATAASANMGAHPVERDTWLDMQAVDLVASCVTDQIFGSRVVPSKSTPGGIGAPHFWKIVNEALDVPCVGVPLDEWKAKVMAELKDVGEEHVLWPVQHFLGPLGPPREPMKVYKDPDEALCRAIESNVRYLKRIGMIKGSGPVEEQSPRKVFKRTKNTGLSC